MKNVHALGLAALVAAAPARAGSDEAPCAAVKTTVLPPCAAPDASTVATLDGAPIAPAELGESLRERRAVLKDAVAEARRAALKAEIDDVLLDLEAARRKVSAGSLLEAEVVRKTAEPSDADLARVYAEWKAKGADRTLEDLKPVLAGILRDEKRALRQAEFAGSLRERFPVKDGVDAGASGLGKDTLLATVGGRPITTSSAATRLDSAEFAVRLGLYFDEKAAFEKLAHARLLKAEAEKRGVTPESLEKENVRVEEGHAVRFLGEAPVPPVLSLDLSRGSSRGSAAAPVTVVEWADFQCPPCSRMWTTLEEALEPYGDRVRYVYVQYPLAFHEFAQKAAEASLAARAQGRFFEYADLLFKNQNALDVPSLKKYAAGLGLDAARFAADLDGGVFVTDVLLDRRSGSRAGVTGTPQVFVNGVWLARSARTVAGVRGAVDAALAKAGASAGPVAPKAAAR